MRAYGAALLAARDAEGGREAADAARYRWLRDAQLAAYRRAVNRIDDRTEYREFTRADITAILAELTEELRALTGKVVL
jgi:ribose 1,5-bisphosphokinase PhnN